MDGVKFFLRSNHESKFRLPTKKTFNLESITSPEPLKPTAGKNEKAFTMQIPNDISKIAAMIQKDWKTMPEEASTYLKKMHQLHSIYDRYGNLSAKFIIRSFLNHARYWHGEVAREVKKKLNEMTN